MKAPIDPCPLCGLDMVMVGRMHRCIPRPVSHKPVTNRVSTPVTNRMTDKAIEVNRVMQWRGKNRERYNTYMKAYMARRRGTRIAQDARVDG